MLRNPNPTPCMHWTVMNIGRLSEHACINVEKRQINAPMRMEARRPSLSQTEAATKEAKKAVIFRQATVMTRKRMSETLYMQEHAIGFTSSE